MKKVYLAGKVSKNDWRHAVVDNLRDSLWDSIQSNAEKHIDAPSCCSIEGKILEKMRASIPMLDGKHTYVGPILISDDHGCYHGDMTHGAIVLDYNESGVKGYEALERKGLFKANAAALENADVLVAYIQSFDCFGTFAEIGHAFGKGIPVHIIYEKLFFNKLIDRVSSKYTRATEFWYLEEMAKTVTPNADEGMLFNIINDILS